MYLKYFFNMFEILFLKEFFPGHIINIGNKQ